ncbi:MAG: SDR family oxidoreductase, partial [Gordonia sp. (in: high G+C Gram-positive bacteria)]|uniref:SDR family oxidoreductase n=1 Tax=Gordonia sp. (in: high G+C Gram-positive bacteria) TaxID=84139 RepID=UPI003BB7A663
MKVMTGMKIVVLGASGTMGRQVAEKLTARGVEVVAAHRGSGVDALTGEGLAAAVDGADVVVDCLNLTTQSGRKATEFFRATAAHVADAASQAGARLVCLSICHAVDPAVNAKMGYYRGKAAQEEAYRERLGGALTVVRTTQWFELARTISDQFSLGPVAAVPHMITAPLAAADGADAIVANVVEPAAAVVEVCGPE